MRSCSFDVDRGRVRAVNQNFADLRRLAASAFVLVVVLLVLGVFAIRGTFLFVVLGAVALAGAAAFLGVGVWLAVQARRVPKQYADAPLVPAVVAQVLPRGVTLLALVNIARDQAGAPAYALVSRNVPRESSTPTLGTRVPATAVLADRSKHEQNPVYTVVSFMPIDWGTTDQEVVRTAAGAIPEAEWRFLADCVDQAPTVQQSKEGRLIIAESDLPEFLR